MSCSPFDLRDYFLKELSDPERRQVEQHVRGCRTCREDLDRLSLTQTALFSLREEEIPQRIGFVSDQVFEPSPWRRGWAAFWGSAARLGFASAAMLSVALVVFSVTRPAVPVSAVDIRAAVNQAVADSEVRHEKRLEQLAVAYDEMLDYTKRHELVVKRAGYVQAGGDFR
jgi:anti-sigma factor RsiW